MADTPGRGSRVARWIGAVVLLVLSAVLAVTAVVARYADGKLLDTDQYVDTVAPLATDPAVQSAVVERVTDEIVTAIDVPKLLDEAAGAVDLERAPALANLLAAPVGSALESFVHSKVDEFVHSAQFPALWTDLNRVAHNQVDAVLTGQGTDVVSTEGTDIVVDLGPVVTAVKDRLVARGLSIAGRVPDVSIPFTVADVEQLPKIQRGVRLLDTAAFWLPLVAIVLLGLAVWLAPDPRRGLIVGCLLIAVLSAIMLLANQRVRVKYSDQLAERGRSVPAGLSVYDTVLRFLLDGLGVICVVALVAVVGLWLAGPGRMPRAVQRLTGRGFDALARLVPPAPGWARVGRFIARNRTAYAIALVLLAALVLLTHPTVGTAIWTTVVSLLAVGLLAVAARWAPHPTAPAE
jgi:hypothetical protein